MEKELTTMAIAIQADVPVLAEGLPGTGETESGKQLASHIGMEHEVVIASIRDSPDFGGLPIHKGDRCWLAPARWVRHVLDKKNVLVILDEVNTAPPSVQGALLTTVLGKVSGDTKLPDEVRFLAFMNPVEIAQGAGGGELAPALANRFLHVPWNITLDEYTSGMVMGWENKAKPPILPEGWEEGVKDTNIMITAFLKARPQWLVAFPKNDDAKSKTWPSMRTWSMAS